MRPPALMVLAAIVMAAGVVFVSMASAQQSPKDDIAAQIRDQGYKCASPQSAERDQQASKPDEAVWVLNCEDASYRLRLIPDLAAKVELIDNGKDDQSGGHDAEK